MFSHHLVNSAIFFSHSVNCKVSTVFCGSRIAVNCPGLSFLQQKANFVDMIILSYLRYFPCNLVSDFEKATYTITSFLVGAPELTDVEI